jgi:hypothetical protein
MLSYILIHVDSPLSKTRMVVLKLSRNIPRGFNWQRKRFPMLGLGKSWVQFSINKDNPADIGRVSRPSFST